ncbi:hypothetical protein B224_1932 [Aeromonas media WS]|nr:hypothetical protein B224_1932 [Aeromonas media WS]
MFAIVTPVAGMAQCIFPISAVGSLRSMDKQPAPQQAKDG